jgi:signal transduction histidine kinase
LRSPLTSITAFVEGLIDGVADTPETQQEYLQIIKQKAEDINNMVSQLFSYSQMDMGNYPITPEKLDVAKEISDFVSVSQEEYKTRGLLLEIDAMPTKTHVYADPLHLRSIFANILDNSAKYKDKENINATICCKTSEDAVFIIFEDNGPGVPEDVLPKLFDVFYRADPSRRNPQQGSGLGLPIVQKALERMGGSVEAENIKSGGLRMTIKIPKMKGA